MKGQRPTHHDSPSPIERQKKILGDTSLESFIFLGEGSATDASLSPLLCWNPSTLVEAIARWSRQGSLGGRLCTPSSSWLLGVGFERKKRRSWRRERRHYTLGAPLYSPGWSAMSGSEPSDQPSMAKEAPRDQLGTLLIPTTCLEQLCDGYHVVKVESGGHWE
jgi:hypothetical protein